MVVAEHFSCAMDSHARLLGNIEEPMVVVVGEQFTCLLIVALVGRLGQGFACCGLVYCGFSVTVAEYLSVAMDNHVHGSCPAVGEWLWLLGTFCLLCFSG